MVENVSVRAWLLDFGRGLKAAVGSHEMFQVLIKPTLFEVACTPSYCSEVLVFQDYILPVLDVPTLLEGQKIIHANNEVVGIAVYQEDFNHPLNYGCLHLANMPTNIFISDDHACEMPAHQRYWEPLALSCFYHDGLTIPVLDLPYLFSGDLSVIQAKGVSRKLNR